MLHTDVYKNSMLSMNDIKRSDNLNRWEQQVRKGLIELLVLLHLRQEPHYGYSLMQALQALLGISISEGTIYPLMKRLEKEACVESYWQIQPSGPARKYYKATAHGMATADEMYAVWDQLYLSVAKLRSRSL